MLVSQYPIWCLLLNLDEQIQKRENFSSFNWHCFVEEYFPFMYLFLLVLVTLLPLFWWVDCCFTRWEGALMCYHYHDSMMCHLLCVLVKPDHVVF